jgi:hypothetical protein
MGQDPISRIAWELAFCLWQRLHFSRTVCDAWRWRRRRQMKPVEPQISATCVGQLLCIEATARLVHRAIEPPIELRGELGIVADI